MKQIYNMAHRQIVARRNIGTCWLKKAVSPQLYKSMIHSALYVQRVLWVSNKILYESGIPSSPLISQDTLDRLNQIERAEEANLPAVLQEKTEVDDLYMFLFKPKEQIVCQKLTRYKRVEFRECFLEDTKFEMISKKPKQPQKENNVELLYNQIHVYLEEKKELVKYQNQSVIFQQDLQNSSLSQSIMSRSVISTQKKLQESVVSTGSQKAEKPIEWKTNDRYRIIIKDQRPIDKQKSYALYFSGLDEALRAINKIVIGRVILYTDMKNFKFQQEMQGNASVLLKQAANIYRKKLADQFLHGLKQRSQKIMTHLSEEEGKQPQSESGGQNEPLARSGLKRENIDLAPNLGQPVEKGLAANPLERALEPQGTGGQGLSLTRSKKETFAPSVQP